MPATGISSQMELSDAPDNSGCANTVETSECPGDKARPSTSTSDGEYKKRAKQKYHQTCMNKWVELYYIDHSRRSMYKDLQKDYENPLAERFDPTTPAPKELSSWLYLFHAYLQLEEVYAEALEWLNFPGHRLIDPPLPWRSFREEAQDFWSDFVECCVCERGQPGSRAAQHKRY